MQFARRTKTLLTRKATTHMGNGALDHVVQLSLRDFGSTPTSLDSTVTIDWRVASLPLNMITLHRHLRPTSWRT